MAPTTAKKASEATFDLIVTSARVIPQEKSEDGPSSKSARRKRKRSDDVDWAPQLAEDEDDSNNDRASDAEFIAGGKKRKKDKKSATPSKPLSPAEVQAKTQKAKFNKRNPNYNDYPQEFKYIVDNYEDELKRMQKRIDGATNTRNKLKRSVAHQKKLHAGTLGSVDDLEMDLDSQAQKNLDLRQDLEQTAQERNKHREALDGVCEDQLELLRRNDVPLQDDGEVKRQLASLLQSCRDWVKGWGFRTWADSGFSGALQLKSELLRGDAESSATERAGLAILQGKIPLRVLLLAFLNRELCQKTFIEPLGILKADEDDQKGDKYCWRTLELLSKRLRPAAERMRAMMLLAHTVQPSDQLDDPSGYDLSPIETRIQKCVDHVMHRISLVCTPLLRKVTAADDELRDSQLKSIVRSFTEAGIRTNAQYPRTLTLFRHKLSKCRFAQEDHRFEPSRALKLQEDEDDGFPTAREAGLEGRQIDLVVEPAIVRKGDKDGLTYEEPRYLIKAVVWMVREEDLKGKSLLKPRKRIMEPPTTESPQASSTSSDPPDKTEQPQLPPTAATGPPPDAVNEQTAVAPESVGENGVGTHTRKKKRRSSQALDSPNKKQCTSAPGSGPENVTTGHQAHGTSSVLQHERPIRSQKDVSAARNMVSKQGQTIEVGCNIKVTSTDSSPASEGVRTCPAGTPYCVSDCKPQAE